jgi:hypothetical protein
VNNLPHNAFTFTGSKHGFGTLSLWALEDLPVIEWVAIISLDHSISIGCMCTLLRHHMCPTFSEPSGLECQDKATPDSIRMFVTIHQEINS